MIETANVDECCLIVLLLFVGVAVVGIVVVVVVVIVVMVLEAPLHYCFVVDCFLFLTYEFPCATFFWLLLSKFDFLAYIWVR